MQKSADSLLCLFDKKRNEKFTGGIKIGFDSGRPVNCSEYSDPKDLPPPVPKGFSVREQIKKACASDYYGSHTYILSDGEITHASTVRTWSGQGIHTLLDELSPDGNRSAKLS
ncbi:hypothetical protein [Treponema sp. R6D11]